MYTDGQRAALSAFSLVLVAAAVITAGRSAGLPPAARRTPLPAERRIHPLTDGYREGRRAGTVELVLAGPAGPVTVEHIDPFPENIDINTANFWELTVLPGVGEGLALRIVRWREQHGPFASISDLDQVPGIGPRLLERCAPLLTVGRGEP